MANATSYSSPHMFRWLNKQGVESSEGFSLQRVHRFYFHYVEGGKFLQVIIEPGHPSSDIVIPENPKWNPPHEKAPLDAQHLEEIKANTGRALTFMKIRYQFVER